MILKKINIQNGFSLLEALLSTIVLAGVFLLIFDILQDYTEEVLAQKTANYMDNVSAAVEDVIRNPDYFDQIYTAADSDADKILEITIPNIIAGNFGLVDGGGVAINVPSSRLADNFSALTPLKNNINIMIRALPDDALEIIVATNTITDDKRVRLAAEYSKLNGGFYRQATDGIVSAYGSWTLQLNAFNTTAWGGAITTTPPTPNTGSYLVNYQHIHFDEIAGDYLYRVAVGTRTDLNTLYGDLNMGGQNILGADNIHPTGDITIDSKAVVNGTMNVVGNANFDGGNFRAFNTLTTQDVIMNRVGDNESSNFRVQGNLNTTQLTLSERINASDVTVAGGTAIAGALSANTIDTQRINAQRINTRSLEASNPSNPLNIDSAKSLNLAEINTQTIDVRNASPNPIGIVDMRVGGRLDVTNDLEMSTAIIQVLDMRGSIFGDCEAGC